MTSLREVTPADHIVAPPEEVQLSREFEPLSMKELFRVVPLKFEPYKEAGHIQRHHVSQPPHSSEWPQVIEDDTTSVWVGGRYWFHVQEGFETVGEQMVVDEDEQDHRSPIMALVTAGVGEEPGDRRDGKFSEVMASHDRNHLRSLDHLIDVAGNIRTEADRHRSLEWLDFEEGDEVLVAIDSLVELLKQRKTADAKATIEAINKAILDDPSRMMIGIEAGKDREEFRFAELRHFELETRDGVIYPVPIVSGVNGDKIGLLPENGTTYGRMYFEATPEVSLWVKEQGSNPNAQETVEPIPA